MIRPAVGPCYRIGDRVRLKAGGPAGTVCEVAAWPRVIGYRVAWDDESDAGELWLERELCSAVGEARSV